MGWGIQYIKLIFLGLMLVTPPLANSEPISVTLEISSNKKTPALLSLACISLVLTFREYFPTEEINDEVLALSPPVLRFPAGMHAMYYDWETC